MKYHGSFPGRVDLLLALFSSVFVLPATAQDNVPQFHTAVPTSPAFTFLGVTPELISRPSSVRDLGSSLLSGIDSEGKARQGFALDFTPWILNTGLSIPLSEYESNVLKRGLANLQLSFGTARSAGDSTSTDVAFGVRTTLYDGTDAMQNAEFTAQIAADLRGCTRTPPGTDPNEARNKIQACADSVMAVAWKNWAKYSEENWNAEFLSIGLGTGARLVDSQFDNGKYSGFKIWGVGGFGVGDVAQFLGQLTFMDSPGLEDTPGFEEFTYGGRLILGSSEFNAFTEILGINGSPSDDENGISWSAGLEFRLLNELWASTGFGKRFDGLDDPDRVLVLVGLRFGLTSQERIKGLTRQ